MRKSVAGVMMSVAGVVEAPETWSGPISCLRGVPRRRGTPGLPPRQHLRPGVHPAAITQGRTPNQQENHERKLS